MSTTTYIGILIFDRTPFNSSLTTAKRLKNNNNNNNQKIKKSDWSMKKKKKRKNCYHKLSSWRSKLSIFNIVLSKECDHLPRVISL